MTVKKILVAIEFTETSMQALDSARTLADALGAELHLLHVIADPLASPLAVHQKQQDRCARLDALLTPEDRARRHATVACEIGTPVHEIAAYAADEGIDLIVMGTHTHGPAFRMMTGSIAEAVMRIAPCAVLTVKGVERHTHALSA